MNMAQRIKKFWEGTNERNAHLGLSGEEDYLLKRAEELVGKRVRVQNKTVIDFGCGGGYMGKYVLSHGAKKYIGFDIAERSVKRAKQNTAEFADRAQFILHNHTWDFPSLKPDIIVCLAVIIHFPSKTYLDNFLSSVNTSGAKNLVLEIRNKGRGTFLQTEPYSAQCFVASPKTCLTCETSPEYVTERLPNYELTDQTNPVTAPTNCQVLWFKKKAKEEPSEPNRS
jgi:SAM-dependent methyltransferase